MTALISTKCSLNILHKNLVNILLKISVFHINCHCEELNIPLTSFFISVLNQDFLKFPFRQRCNF
ncbi:hypothetical protein PUN28_017025 [Cardiocondyla obscurior]|uniref:Uncharacterized protein n=1 Tax=Cardiocondyla obscurior TaxID=286306 RepID=A0AAW2ELK1_9HYME